MLDPELLERFHSRERLALARLLSLVARGDHVGVLVGGIVPEGDMPKLLEMGVARVFGPGTALPDIVAFLRQRGEATHA